MNAFFSNVVKKLEIEGYSTEDIPFNFELNTVSNIITKFKDHPSILKIRENVLVNETFHFSMISEAAMSTEIKSLNKNKPTTFNNIPIKILIDSCEIFPPFLTAVYNDSILKCTFPSTLKQADITPVYKKDERTDKGNYRPVSMLPSVSKLFERTMHDQISYYIDKRLSPYLCGYSAQHCLSIMSERWKKALDSSKIADTLLTDLSKTFDSLHHGLLIAKLDAYGFDNASLSLIFSYLSRRKQRTKINNDFSSLSNIATGVPQGSILTRCSSIYIYKLYFIFYQ